jgi:hypothetical protein
MPFHVSLQPEPSTTVRPKLDVGLSASEFDRWYWLKAERVAFCRSAGWPTVGSKPELAARVRALRDFIHTQVGRTLGEAAACYRQRVAPGAPPHATR